MSENTKKCCWIFFGKSLMRLFWSAYFLYHNRLQPIKTMSTLIFGSFATLNARDCRDSMAFFDICTSFCLKYENIILVIFPWRNNAYRNGRSTKLTQKWKRITCVTSIFSVLFPKLRVSKTESESVFSIRISRSIDSLGTFYSNFGTVDIKMQKKTSPLISLGTKSS